VPRSPGPRASASMSSSRSKKKAAAAVNVRTWPRRPQQPALADAGPCLTLHRHCSQNEGAEPSDEGLELAKSLAEMQGAGQHDTPEVGHRPPCAAASRCSTLTTRSPRPHPQPGRDAASSRTRRSRPLTSKLHLPWSVQVRAGHARPSPPPPFRPVESVRPPFTPPALHVRRAQARNEQRQALQTLSVQPRNDRQEQGTHQQKDRGTSAHALPARAVRVHTPGLQGAHLSRGAQHCGPPPPSPRYLESRADPCSRCLDRPARKRSARGTSAY